MRTAKIVRYAIGVRDGERDFRMLSRDDWKRTKKGDNVVSLTRDTEEAKLWRSENEVWLAFHEFKMGQRGYSCFPVGILVLKDAPMTRTLSPKTLGNVMQAFVAFIGNGENSRGRFPVNLTELNEDCKEFAAAHAGKGVTP